jgi:hypothetical protein
MRRGGRHIAPQEDAMTTKNALAPLALSLIALVLGACANRQTRDDARTDAPPPAPRAQPAPTQPREPAAAPTPPAASAPATDRGVDAAVSAIDETEAQFTGVQVCDEYLASYRACNAVTTNFTAEQIDQRLAELRASWQARAADPAARGTLEQDCQRLTDLMKQALGDRECELPENDFYRPEDTPPDTTD